RIGRLMGLVDRSSGEPLSTGVRVGRSCDDARANRIERSKRKRESNKGRTGGRIQKGDCLAGKDDADSVDAGLSLSAPAHNEIGSAIDAGSGGGQAPSIASTKRRRLEPGGRVGKRRLCDWPSPFLAEYRWHTR